MIVGHKQTPSLMLTALTVFLEGSRYLRVVAPGNWKVTDDSKIEPGVKIMIRTLEMIMVNVNKDVQGREYAPTR